ncbi:uncharacterized protein EAF01_009099 [Botrytis porri]|uniref:uncharacterized protein n=1 Tax=Botrytis porri TaxID=87229 RepID=UPI00190068A4|nr:uncharacterized protein EAF01_009099 [Botrytis porri]KAF7896696.1 hypothetical protein EAF01_009099 [Botrytis porri]
MGDPEIYSPQITPAPTTLESLVLRDTAESTTTYRDPPDIVSTKDLECVPGLKNAIDDAFRRQNGYAMSLWCYPSYGGINDTYVVLDLTASSKDQGVALLDVLRKWAPGWAATSVAAAPGSEPTQWMDPRILIQDDATCQKGSSCSSQQLPLGYCKPNCD